ncbi:MAG TPA: dynamin family protein [Aeromicrobium sp.]|nr:dynamin family protein [Aeromicrobium sp.]
MNALDQTAGQVRTLIGELSTSLAGHPAQSRLAAISARLDGPLRVAIAGRVKAGKSTLLNALVGERLAPTDAGECTKIVTRYQYGTQYGVVADMRAGSPRTLSFTRGESALKIDLDGLGEADIRHMTVNWPSSVLQQTMLIDTPGLASINAENSRRTIDFVQGDDGGGTGEIDAVIYLMRHAHREDLRFLDAFMDRGVSSSSAVNAIGVLSRADEIGAGRLDAMESAARIASRYAADRNLARLVSGVLPLAGLLAETGLTLIEEEAAALRGIAAIDPDHLDRMLLSAQTFCDAEVEAVSADQRRRLLDRLGVFGVRVSVDLIRTQGLRTAADLGPRLVETSGLSALRARISDQFGPRARVLQARSALVSLRALARELESSAPDQARQIGYECERIEASAAEFARIRAAYLVSSGLVELKDDEQVSLTRLLMGTTAVDALGVPSASVRSAALDGVAKWRARAEDPFADPTTREACEAGARTCEVFYASVGG